MKLRLTLTENRKDWPLSHVIVVGKRHCKEEPSDSFKCPALLNQDLIFAPVAESFPITFIRLEEQLSKVWVTQHLGKWYQQGLILF
jgi:hypothetical protein